MAKPGEWESFGIDLRTVTPKQWEAAKSEIARRARAERAETVRELIRRLRCWRRSHRQRRAAGFKPYEPLRAHPLHWSGRA
jgi:hypothetical protein